MNQEKQLQTYIKQLDEKIWKNHQFNKSNQGLVSGELGIIMYCYSMYNYTKDEIYLEKLYSVLELVFESINTEDSHLLKGASIADGLAGFGWILGLLIKDGILEEDYNQYLDSFDEILIESAKQHIKASMFDFLYGAFGIIYYLLHRPNVVYTPAFLSLIQLVIENVIKDEEGIRFYNKDHSKYTHGIVTGLSHGMSGYLLVLLECYKKGIMKEELKEVITNAIKYILKHSSVDESVDNACFPLRVNESEEDLLKNKTKVEFGKRLAWCNGDLGILWMLYKASEILDIKEYKIIANKAMEQCCSRTDFETSRVQDAHFCHGASGVSFFYNTLYKYTKEEKFDTAKKFWEEEMKGFLKKENYDEKNLSLIDGLPGINLVLSAFDHDSASWQQVFLLN